MLLRLRDRVDKPVGPAGIGDVFGALHEQDRADGLVAPRNISLVALCAYNPELNPIERIRLYLRERYLSHRLLDCYDAIAAACCRARNELTPQRLKSLTNDTYLEQVRIQARRHKYRAPSVGPCYRLNPMSVCSINQ